MQAWETCTETTSQYPMLQENEKKPAAKILVNFLCEDCLFSIEHTTSPSTRPLSYLGNAPRKKCDLEHKQRRTFRFNEPENMEIKQKRECTEELIDLMQYFGSLLNENGILPDLITLIWILASGKINVYSIPF